jgi:hypothetical protein
MEKELKLIGQEKLSKEEVLELSEVLNNWISREHVFDLNQAIKDIKNSNISKAGAHARMRVNDSDKKEKTVIQPVPPVAHTKYEKVNTGLYTRLRLLFESEFKRGARVLKFEDVYELAKSEYPTLTVERLGLYLRDWRQFKKIQYVQAKGEILLLEKERPKPVKNGTKKLLSAIKSKF